MFFCRPEHYSSEDYSSPNTMQQYYQDQSNNFESPSTFEQPMTPAPPTPTNMRITRNTRARMRGNIFI